MPKTEENNGIAMKTLKRVGVILLALWLMQATAPAFGADSDWELSVEKIRNESEQPSFGEDYEGFDFFDAKNIKLMQARYQKTKEEIDVLQADVFSQEKRTAGTDYSMIGAHTFDTMLQQNEESIMEESLQWNYWMLLIPLFLLVLLLSSVHYGRKRRERLEQYDYDYNR